jgi:hypothetical protein
LRADGDGSPVADADFLFTAQVLGPDLAPGDFFKPKLVARSEQIVDDEPFRFALGTTAC